MCVSKCNLFITWMMIDNLLSIVWFLLLGKLVHKLCAEQRVMIKKAVYKLIAWFIRNGLSGSFFFKYEE